MKLTNFLKTQNLLRSAVMALTTTTLFGGYNQYPTPGWNQNYGFYNPQTHNVNYTYDYNNPQITSYAINYNNIWHTIPTNPYAIALLENVQKYFVN